MILLKNIKRFIHKIFCGRLYEHYSIRLGIFEFRCKRCGSELEVDRITNEWVKK